MEDGIPIADDVTRPDGVIPAGGWPGVVALHRLGGTEDSWT